MATARSAPMRLEMSSKRAKKLIRDHDLTEEEILQIVASARINLATFDPEYRTNVTQIAEDLRKSRPTIYGWADRALAKRARSRQRHGALKRPFIKLMCFACCSRRRPPHIDATSAGRTDRES